MLELKSFITQSLSPAVAISGIGLLIMGLNNRFSTLGGRIRQLNRELHKSQHPEWEPNLRQQIRLFLERIRLVRNALFLLYLAVGLMVLTAVGIAMMDIGLAFWGPWLPMAAFLTGLFLAFVATILEAWEVVLNLKTLYLDIALFESTTPPV